MMGWNETEWENVFHEKLGTEYNDLNRWVVKDIESVEICFNKRSQRTSLTVKLARAEYYLEVTPEELQYWVNMIVQKSQQYKARYLANALGANGDGI